MVGDFMDNKQGKTKIIQFLTDNKNIVFLCMCLMVHLSYFVVFLALNIVPFYVINIFSSVFYIVVLCKVDKRYNVEKAVVAAYFEIIMFSIASEIFTRNTFGFIYFVLGMIPVIFYLTPTLKNKRFLFELIGVVAAMFIAHTDQLIPVSFAEETYQHAVKYSDEFNYINLFITIFTIIYTYFFYEMELDSVRSELNYNCIHDNLTGLYNRRFLYDFVHDINDENVTVALLDIDNFKSINDCFGHDVGDEILKSVSLCMNQICDSKGYFSVRWGGEEFLIFCRNINADTAYSDINDLCKKISESVILPDRRYVTVTAGLVYGEIKNFENVIKKADDYLYIGKNKGKNCIVWYRNENI